jgi:cytochrome P450
MLASKVIQDPYNLAGAGILSNPYPVYRELRTNDPVYYSEAWNGWVVTRYEDVRAILQDQRFSSARTPAFLQQLPSHVQPELEGLNRYMSLWIGFVDAPEHTRLRSVATKTLAPRLFESLRPRIQEITNRLLEPIAGTGKMDAIRDLAYPLPLTVISELIGIPPEHRLRFKKSSDEFVALVGPSRPTLEKAKAAQAGLSAMIEFLRPVYLDRRENPQADMMSILMRCEADGNLLDEEEVLLLCASLAIGGHETTTNLIGNGLLALLNHPNQLAKLQTEPELINTAVDEFLRYDPPLQRALRVAKEDIEFQGKHIKQGEIVLAMLAAANRDPAVFPEPERLDIARQENRHLTFGYASRYCLGAQLARIEGQVAIGTVVRELSDLQLAETGPQRTENWAFRGLASLPLAWSVKGAVQ